MQLWQKGVINEVICLYTVEHTQQEAEVSIKNSYLNVIRTILEVL